MESVQHLEEGVACHRRIGGFHTGQSAKGRYSVKASRVRGMLGIYLEAHVCMFLKERVLLKRMLQEMSRFYV